MIRVQATLLLMLIGSVAEAAPRPTPSKPPAAPTPPAAQPPAPQRPTPPVGVEGAPEFVPIPGGEILFGCEPGDTECTALEKPARKVKVASFKMLRTEVTLVQYAVCVHHGACTKPGPGLGNSCNWNVEGRNLDPINCVDQAQAKAFCEWIGGRLPTVEEWEYAAKSGGHNIYPWGSEPPDERHGRWGRDDGTSPVGTHPEGATKQGLQDMAGNVWEWTESNVDKKFVAVRGGSWGNTEPRLLRASNPGRQPPTERVDWVGFRCAQ